MWLLQNIYVWEGTEQRRRQCAWMKSLLVRYCPTEICFLLLSKDSENPSCTCPSARNHMAQVERVMSGFPALVNFP